MPEQHLHQFVRRLRQSLRPEVGGLTDAQLLERFVASRDEAAFEVLVWRHGPMVLGACRRLLHQVQDAEDAFQATFLALARKAGSIGHREALAGWLHTTACRTAMRVRQRTAQHSRLQQLPEDLPARETGDELTADLRPVLDEEIARLPVKYRQPVILCYLQGKTTEEAARQLGCARGTICSRLSWARNRLRFRLTRRGLAWTTATLGTALAGETAQALPGGLVLRTLQGALGFAGGQATVGIAPQVVTLAEGVLKTMVLTKLKLAAVVVLLAGVAALGAGLVTQQVRAEKPNPAAIPELAAGDADALRLPAGMLAPIGIRVAEVRQRGAQKPRILRLPASTALDPNRLTRIRSRVSGEVLAIAKAVSGESLEIGNTFRVKTESQELRPGSMVRKGQLLALIRSPDVGSKKSELLDALVQLDLDKKRLKTREELWRNGSLPEDTLNKTRRDVQNDQNAADRAERTLRTWNIPDKEIEAVKEEARAIGKRGGQRDKDKERLWAKFELLAPRDGVIVERNINVGDSLADNTVNLFTIASLDRLLVFAQAPKEELPSLTALKPDERVWTVKTEMAAFADNALINTTVTVEGTIQEIGSLVGPFDQQTVPVKGIIDNPRGQFRPGQFVTVTITLPVPSGEMAVPASAVVEEGGKNFVFLQPDPKQLVYRQRRVLVVRRGPEVVHIRSPLSPQEERQGFQPLRPGDRIITGGAVELKALLDDLNAQEKR